MLFSFKDTLSFITSKVSRLWSYLDVRADFIELGKNCIQSFVDSVIGFELNEFLVRIFKWHVGYTNVAKNSLVVLQDLILIYLKQLLWCLRNSLIAEFNHLIVDHLLFWLDGSLLSSLGFEEVALPYQHCFVLSSCAEEVTCVGEFYTFDGTAMPEERV